MTEEEMYIVWAPADGIWTTWVKPVLFNYLDRVRRSNLAEPAPAIDVAFAPVANGSQAIVVDLPSDAGIWMGVALAKIGYAPIPLYNAIPESFRWASFATSTDVPSTSVVNIQPILTALVAASPQLALLHLPFAAPPVFLLDANRRTGDRRVVAGRFDNRSISLPTDFPSANFLLAHGIREVILVQSDAVRPQTDLAHTLRRWQEAGIQVLIKSINDASAPTAINIQQPSWFRLLFYNALATMGLRRSPFGGFGGRLPHAAAG